MKGDPASRPAGDESLLHAQPVAVDPERPLELRSGDALPAPVRQGAAQFDAVVQDAYGRIETMFAAGARAGVGQDAAPQRKRKLRQRGCETAAAQVVAHQPPGEAHLVAPGLPAAPRRNAARGRAPLAGRLALKASRDVDVATVRLRKDANQARSVRASVRDVRARPRAANPRDAARILETRKTRGGKVLHAQVERMIDGLKDKNYGLRSLIHAVVQSDAFLKR